MNIKNTVHKACLTVMLSMASSLGLALSSNAEDKAFLWEVESPNNTVYLLGSVHLLRETDYPLSQPIQAAFNDAETLCI